MANPNKFLSAIRILLSPKLYPTTDKLLASAIEETKKSTAPDADDILAELIAARKLLAEMKAEKPAATPPAKSGVGA